MKRHGQWTIGWCIVGGALALAACGPPEVPQDANDGEPVSLGASELFKEQAQPPANDALVVEDPTLKLARFWAIDRFERDDGEPVIARKSLHWKQLAKATPDECFTDVGQPIVKAVDGQCASGTPKVNDAYVWGLTKYGSKLFFGTLANTLCLVEYGYLGVDAAQRTPEWVCEFSASQYTLGGKSLGGMGDFRPPNMFVYDLEAQQSIAVNPPPYSGPDLLRWGTTGLRSAGTLPGSGVVFLAGPSSSRGVNVFALDATSGTVLSAFTIGANPPDGNYYNNVRNWVVANGALYVGVGRHVGGAVLRWTGSKDAPNSFVEVGHLPGDAANMVVHDDGRIYVTTWPSGDLPTGLFRSPVIPDCGLTAVDADAADWSTPLWLATYDARFPDVPWYDPDTVTGRTVGGGAIVSFKGRLYFGTMSVPFVAAEAASKAYSLPDSDLLRTALGTHRSIALFEVKFPGKAKVHVSMLFGEKYLPKYDAAAGGYTISYDRAHRTGFVPRWGASGVGNFFNTYTWSGTVYRNQVFFGTFDWSQLARVMLEEVAAGQIADPKVRAAFLRALGPGFPREGADLIRFSDDRVHAESVNGLGNNRNYGIRNMITDGRKLWVGTANPMNLDAKGGWELIELK